MPSLNFSNGSGHSLKPPEFRPCAYLNGLGAGELVLLKSVESGDLSVNKAVIRWMSVEVYSPAASELPIATFVCDKSHSHQ